MEGKLRAKVLEEVRHDPGDHVQDLAFPWSIILVTLKWTLIVFDQDYLALDSNSPPVPCWDWTAPCIPHPC